jgi:SAM-dependent methyltransferase
VFNNEDLHYIRADELNVLASRIATTGTVLELGAGTGFQARELASRGLNVEAIDLPSSSHSSNRLYPIIDYDGSVIPFPDASFDVVFSSHVLEHVRDVPSLLAETRRVLKPGGYAVHSMPSSAWRFWTTLTGAVDFVPFVAATLTGTVPRPSARKPRGPLMEFARGTAARFAPLPHGETGNALTELVTFSKRHWVKQFENNGFEVVRAEPMNLFYTGWCLLGRRVPLETRRRIARTLGSVSYLYEVRPK